MCTVSLFLFLPFFLYNFVVAEDVPLVEFMYLVFICMPGERYRRRLQSLLCLCDIFQALVNSLASHFLESVIVLV